MTKRSFLTREAVREVYDRNARFYDFAVWGYYLAGMPICKWRRMAVAALELRPGDTVVEIGCGTGLNFDLLQEVVGPKGKIVGIDISEGMLERARALVRNRGWENVELFSGSVSDFKFRGSVGGIIAMGVLTYEPDFDNVIERGAKALTSGRRWVVLDYKMPNGWQRIFTPLFIAMGSCFGVSKDLMDRHVWEAVERHLQNIQMREFYGGFVYVISGEAY